MGLNNKLGVSIKGESKPKIPHPKDKDWSGLSLPWMVYGYGVLLSPLQILTFYNAVANDGEMVKPIFVKKNKLKSNKIILNPSIASKSTINKAKFLLENVVNDDGGTGFNIRSNIYKIAGKTGTGQVDYTTDDVQYISSFVGYFPADKPKYSCIVVIHKPNKKMGYYGNIVAAPVFKKIADKIYSLTPKDKKTITIEQKDLNKIIEENSLVIVDNNFSVIKGKNLKNVLPKLENLGYKVKMSGRGNVIKNYKVNSTKKSIEVELIWNY